MSRERAVKAVLAPLPVLLLLLQLLICLPAALHAAEGDVADFELDNGMRVYVIEKHAAPVASVQVWYRTGCLNERPGIRGLSHLFEHMMFRGSERFGPEEHHRQVSRLGGWSNAYTSFDVTVYHQTLPVAGVESVLEMEADRMARLKLSEELLRTEVEVVKEEYRVNYENNPEERLTLRFAQDYFGDHPYAWTAIGRMQDLDTVSVATCLDYYRSRYAPNNATLIVAGDVDPQEVLEMARRHFGAIPAAAGIQPDPPPPPAHPPSQLQGKEDLPVALSGILYRLPPASDPDVIPLEILAGLLNDRLDDRLTRKTSLGIGVEKLDYFLRQCGLAGVVCAHFANVPAEKVIAVIDDEVALLAHDPVEQAELDRQRNQILIRETLAHGRANAMAEELGDALFIAEDVSRYTDRRARIAAVTPLDIQTVARRHFTPENRTEVRMTPKSVPLLVKVVGWVTTTLHL